MSELVAGRDLDALVAERVMGWEAPTWHHPEGWGTSDSSIPHFSTDISAAWEVVEKMRPDWTLDFRATCEGYFASFDNMSQTFEHFSRESAAHAICLAALKALESPVTR